MPRLVTTSRADGFTPTAEETRQLLGIIRVVEGMLEERYTNVKAIARELDVSRVTLYRWAGRMMATMVQTLRSFRVGRPSSEGPQAALFAALRELSDEVDNRPHS